MRNFFLKILLFIGLSTYLHADKEKFDFYPAHGTFSADQKLLTYIKELQQIKVYNNKLLYSPSFRLIENKFLIIKALELGQMSNETFLNDIENIEATYNKIDSVLKKASIEENVKNIFQSSAILDFTTDTLTQSLSRTRLTKYALKQVLENEKIKSLLIKEISYINEVNYDFYTTMILSSVDLILEIYGTEELKLCKPQVNPT